jgi:hypothetical protein
MKYLALTIMFCSCAFGLLLVITGLLAQTLTETQTIICLAAFTAFLVFSLVELLKIEG